MWAVALSTIPYAQCCCAAATLSSYAVVLLLRCLLQCLAAGSGADRWHACAVRKRGALEHVQLLLAFADQDGAVGGGLVKQLGDHSGGSGNIGQQLANVVCPLASIPDESGLQSSPECRGVGV